MEIFLQTGRLTRRRTYSGDDVLGFSYLKQKSKREIIKKYVFFSNTVAANAVRFLSVLRYTTHVYTVGIRVFGERVALPADLSRYFTANDGVQVTAANSFRDLPPRPAGVRYAKITFRRAHKWLSRGGSNRTRHSGFITGARDRR